MHRAILTMLSRAWGALAGSRFAFHAIVAVLLLVPHVFGSRESAEPYFFGLPRIASGDEPHYLVYINSLIEDHDLDIANNYDAVHHGSDQAGLLFKGSRLDHHAIWWAGDVHVGWYAVFEDPAKWQPDASGAYVPTVRAGVDPAWLPKHELPWNVPGLAILLALVLFPFAHSHYVEPAATIVSGLVTILATIFWRRLARLVTDDQRTINVGLALAFLGTPAWHYGRSLFSEPYLICLILGAYAFALVRPKYVVSGLLLGAAVFIKPFIVVLGMPIGLLLLWRRRWRDAFAYAVPVVLWIALLLFSYHVIYGSALRSPNEWRSGPVFINALHILAYPTRGLLTTAPIALVALAGWPGLLKKERAFAAAAGACAVLFVLVAWNRAWAGGFAYSVRYVMPIVPLLCLGLLVVIEHKLQTLTARIYFAGVGLLSILVNALAAIQYWRAFNGHPFIYLLRNSDF